MPRPFSPRAFKNRVRIRPVDYTPGDQGGTNPTPAPGWEYRASVQPLGGGSGEVKAGAVGEMIQSVVTYDVLIDARYADDPAIRDLSVGDEILWIDRGDAVLSVLVPPQDSGGLGKLLRIRTESVT